MLLEFGVKNFFSFKEQTSISLRLDAKCPSKISRGRNFATAMCIKGANGSGKTQILKALAFLSHFCTKSFDQKPEEKIGVASHFRNKEPSELYIEFIFGDVEYRYELLATVDEIHRETLYKKNKRKTKIVERIKNELVVLTNDFSRLSTMSLRKNASFISTSTQYGFDELIEPNDFFTRIATNVTYKGLTSFSTDISAVSKFLDEHNETFEFVKKLIKECDIGIEDIKIQKLENKDGVEDYFPIFYHLSDGQLHGLSDFMESSGTRTLFTHLAFYQITLEFGGALVMDEFDINLHPHILPKLVELFLSDETNKNGAQIIFSTHDSEILNILGRYCVHIVMKQDNESFAFRLDEVPGDILRNDRPIRQVYNDGKIGGVPRL